MSANANNPGTASHGLFIKGEWTQSGETRAVINKYTGAEIARVAQATLVDVDSAVAAADGAFRSVAFPPYRRFDVLSRASQLVSERRVELVDTMVQETGFTVREAEADWARTVQTLLTSAEEDKRIAGEMVPLDGTPSGEGRLAFTLRAPVGPVCAITPFNSPLNTVAHKVGPALAAGNSVVLKPATYTPLSAIALCRILDEAGTPAGYLNLVHGGGGEVGDALLRDERFRFYAFTGSAAVGQHIQETIGLRRSQLELGNISATIVHEDANLDRVVERVAGAAFRKAGQVCTSVQRLLAHRRVLDELAERLAARAREMATGDPTSRTTDMGRMIHEREAMRAQQWVEQSLSDGAVALTPVQREGALMRPVILRNVRPEMQVMAAEIFAPVVSLLPFDTLDEAIEMVNATPYGLTAGIFTYDFRAALHAARRLEVGVVQINETSSSRVDAMPYGGAKESGFGKEGPRYAIREMTEERLVIFNLE